MFVSKRNDVHLHTQVVVNLQPGERRRRRRRRKNRSRKKNRRRSLSLRERSPPKPSAARPDILVIYALRKFGQNVDLR